MLASQPSYFPVWSIDELHQGRKLCYQTIEVATVTDRFEKYGGVAHYIFRQQGEPPSLEGVIIDSDTWKNIRHVGEMSQLFPSSHMLLHIAVDDNMHFKLVVLVSHWHSSFLQVLSGDAREPEITIGFWGCSRGTPV